MITGSQTLLKLLILCMYINHAVIGLQVVGNKQDTQMISFEKAIRTTIPRTGSRSFCLQHSNWRIWKSLFSQIKVTVSVTNSQAYLSKFGVRGISSDDFQAHAKSLGVNIISMINPEVYNHRDAQSISRNSQALVDQLQQGSGVRDLLSACPQPFDHHSQQCELVFSPLGDTCILLTGQNSSDLPLLIETALVFNAYFLVTLVLGIALLLIAVTFSFRYGMLFTCYLNINTASVAEVFW